jgi:hypothetical protein
VGEWGRREWGRREWGRREWGRREWGRREWGSGGVGEKRPHLLPPSSPTGSAGRTLCGAE